MEMKKEEEETLEVPKKVPNGGGCVLGLTEEEHIRWSQEVQHGGRNVPPVLPRGLTEAMEYEAERPPKLVDEERENIVGCWLRKKNT